MRLDAIEEDKIAFARRKHAKSALLIGVALGVIAALPLALGVGAVVPRLLTTLVVGGLSFAFVRIGWPRLERVIVHPVAGTLTHAGAEVRLGEGARFNLTTRPRSSDFEWPVYRIEVATQAGQSIRLLEHSSPELVLRDLARARSRWPLPVTTGWGLPESAAPWAYDSAAAPTQLATAAARRIPVDGTDVVAQRETGRTVIFAGLAVALLMVRAVATRLSLGDEPLGLDIVLPVVTISLVLLVGAAVLTRKVRLFSNGALSVEYRLLGLTLKRVVVPRESVRGAHAVGALPARPWHVLLDTTLGPVAIPSYDGRAKELKATIDGRLAKGGST